MVQGGFIHQSLLELPVALKAHFAAETDDGGGGSVGQPGQFMDAFSNHGLGVLGDVMRQIAFGGAGIVDVFFQSDQ